MIVQIRDAMEVHTPAGSRTYQSFLQDISLFNRGIITSTQLRDEIRPYLSRHTELWTSFCDLIRDASSYGTCGEDTASSDVLNAPETDLASDSRQTVSSNFQLNHNIQSLVQDIADNRIDLDFRQLMACGVSYRALPPNLTQSKCSGKMKCPIAKEVLNDTYMSFSSMSSEDSQFISSKKNQYEENLYRVEDERYEVDMVTELNRAALENLVVIKRQLDRMTREALNQYRLDEYLGGTSAILMRKAIHRVYGDKAADVIHGLKTCPNSVVPLVIQRMRQKDSEWKESIRMFQLSWGEQDARNYLRSLDHQGSSFKQKDCNNIRSKAFVAQIEALAQHNQHPEPSEDPIGDMLYASLLQQHHVKVPNLNSPGSLGNVNLHVFECDGPDYAPHLMLLYPPPDARTSLLADAASLIIHHVKRLSNYSKEDKRNMKFLIRSIVQDIFLEKRFPMSDDEDDEEEMDISTEENVKIEPTITARPRENALVDVKVGDNLPSTSHQPAPVYKLSDETKNPLAELPLASHLRDDYYSLFYGSNHWYAFIRLHHLLLCRLNQLRERGLILAAESEADTSQAIIAADALRLRPSSQLKPCEFYNCALSLVKDILDGNEDTNSFEDRLREMFGIYAYPSFSMDRVVMNIVRELQALISNDDLSRRLTNLFKAAISTSSAVSYDGAVPTYQQKFTNRSPSLVASGTRGPVSTRLSRLGPEAAYRDQAIDLCKSFAATKASSTNVGQGGPNGLPVCNQPSTDCTTYPNCYTLVMLGEASLMLIHLLRSTEFTNPKSGKQRSCLENAQPLPCHHVLLDKRSGANRDGTTSLKSGQWLNYVNKCLNTDIRQSPIVASYTKPVFLFRTVRKCLRHFARKAHVKRKQDLVETGDTQPHELLPHNVAQLGSTDEPTEKDTESGLPSVDLKSARELVALLEDKFIKDELYRATYSSDCMQSLDRASIKSNPKAHKINWSVGSYGIFNRSRGDRDVSYKPLTSKWNAFHDAWLVRVRSQVDDPEDLQASSSEPMDDECGTTEAVTAVSTTQPSGIETAKSEPIAPPDGSCAADPDKDDDPAASSAQLY